MVRELTLSYNSLILIKSHAFEHEPTPHRCRVELIIDVNDPDSVQWTPRSWSKILTQSHGPQIEAHTIRLWSLLRHRSHWFWFNLTGSNVKPAPFGCTDEFVIDLNGSDQSHGLQHCMVVELIHRPLTLTQSNGIQREVNTTSSQSWPYTHSLILIRSHGFQHEANATLLQSWSYQSSLTLTQSLGFQREARLQSWSYHRLSDSDPIS